MIGRGERKGEPWHSGARSLPFVCLLLVGGSVPLLGQSTGLIRDTGGYPFRTPGASPSEPLTRLSVAHVSRDTADRLVALPDLGERLPFWIHRDPDGPWELAGAVAGGVFARFDLESTDNEFIEVHFRVGLQARARYRGLALRAELYHVSSHLGDEYLVRTGREPISTSREGIDLLLQGEPLPGLLLYGGPGVLFRSTESLDPASLRAGFEWEFARLVTSGEPGEEASEDGEHRPWAVPYVAFDAYAWSELGWEPTLAFEGGVRLGRYISLALGLGTGPSRAEQFFREDERLISVTFSFRR
jgi:hypothetical protein